MEDLKTRMGYLRGLAEGLGISEETKEGKIIQQIIVFLNELVGSVEELREDYDELFSYVESLDEDLSELEDELNSEDDDYLEDYDDDDDDDDDDLDDEFLFDDDEEYDIPFVVECPECHENVTIDEDILEDEESLEVLCPTCGKVVFNNDDDWDDDLDDEEENDK